MELPDLHARSKGLLMAVPSLAHPTTAILTPGSCSWARVPTSREWGPQLAIRGGGEASFAAAYPAGGIC